MRYLLICIISVYSLTTGYAQIPINNPIDPTDTELNTAVKFVSNYLSEFTIKNKYLPDFSKYWSEADCTQYRIPDRLLYAVNAEIPTYMLGTPTILMAKPEQGMVHIKVMFSRIDSAGKLLVTAITNHYIRHDTVGKLLFVNPMQVVVPEWQTTDYGSITYHYPAYHRFDKKKAKDMEAQIAKLEHDWGLIPIWIQYYFADTREELEHYRGFDFTIAMGNRNKPSGISDGIDNIIYCGGWGENYFHEVVHIYLNKLFPQSPLTEGLAVFYGGSLGHDLAYHLKRLNQYLKQHPEIDLNDIDEFYYMDNFTNPLSTIQGLLCSMAYNKDGITGLRRTMKYPTLDALLQKEYGVKKGEWDKFFRERIEKIEAR